MNEWFHPNQVLKLHPKEPLEASRVNGHLYFSELMIHRYELGFFNHSDLKRVKIFLDKLHITTDSHDNLTGVLSLIRVFKDHIDKEVYERTRKYLVQMLNARIRHPRDYIFFYFNSPFIMLLIYLISVPIGIFIDVARFGITFVMSVTKYKWRDTDGDGVKDPILKTDGIKLYYLRRATQRKTLTGFLNKIINWILVLRFGKDHEKKVMDIFFKDPNHPLRNLYV